VTDEQTAAYKAALKEARESFQRARTRLGAIQFETYTLNEQIARLRRTITALSALCSENPFADQFGITDACMEVMDLQEGEVTTADVVKGLENIGFDLASQKNANASVHAVLTRLAAKGKIEKVDGEVVTWKGPKFDPSYDPDDIPF
jgi:hypothetical protein